MKQIIVVKPKSLDKESKDLLKKDGIIVIEHEDPSAVRVITQLEGLDGNDIFMCAIDAIQRSTYKESANLFGTNMLKLFKPKS